MKYILAIFNSIILSFMIVTIWSIVFSDKPSGILPYIASLFTNVNYYTAVGIFSVLFFLFFSLPLSFFIRKD